MRGRPLRGAPTRPAITRKDENGDTPLHLAAAAGNVPALKWLTSRYTRWDDANRKGETALHLAATGGSIENLEILLTRTRNLDQPDSEGQTPLARAVGVDDRAIIRFLVKRGADLNRRNADDATVLTQAFARGDLDLVRFLVNLGADPQSLGASMEDFHKMVRRFHDIPTSPSDYAFGVALLASLVKDIDAPDKDGVTPLMWVASSNVVSALDSVLKRGPNLNARSRDGRTALMWAATSGADEAFVRLKEAGADASLKDHEGKTAADWREWFTRSRVGGPSPDPESGEPIGQRIERVRRKALRTYLSRGSYSPEDRLAGSDPLHLAAALGEMEALKVLLAAGVEIDRRMADGTTALMEAAHGRRHHRSDGGGGQWTRAHRSVSPR